MLKIGFMMYHDSNRWWYIYYSDVIVLGRLQVHKINLDIQLVLPSRFLGTWHFEHVLY